MTSLKVLIPRILAFSLPPLLSLASSANQQPSHPGRPKLILQITVDQLRGSEPPKYRGHFRKGGGFHYLMNGTWFSTAHHRHSHTETVVGHTTLATGAYPAQHGMIGNSWYDRATNQKQYCLYDKRYVVVGTNDVGASPERILASTFSDELARMTAGRAKIFSVSAKDRAAVPLAGHSGRAFWFYPKNGQFVSSTYYFSAYPEWVTRWNQRRLPDRWANRTYSLLNSPDTYMFGQLPSYASPFFDRVGYRRTFPHHFASLAAQQAPLYYAELIGSPAGDQLTLEFAKELIQQEHLGAGASPDYLALSFSSTDIIGHNFSHTSLEYEDNLLRLDVVLGELFSFIDKQVGLDNTLIVLASDHGAPEIPEYLRSKGIPTGRLQEKEINDRASAALKARFGREDLILAFETPYFYLNDAAIRAAGLNKSEIEQTMVNSIMGINGVALVASSHLSRSHENAHVEGIMEQIRRNHHPQRSGDVYVVQSPHWQIVETGAQKGPVVLGHGSPWPYDTHVPVVFAGARVPRQLISRPVSTVDVAATLAAYVGANQPSGSVGKPLVEVFRSK